jgi:prevent-host-death family protein
MIKEATAMTVRQNLGELLNGIQYGSDQVVITKGGKPVAAMVDTVLFDKIRLLKREFNRLTDELAVAYQGIDESVAQQEIDAAVKQVRKR